MTKKEGGKILVVGSANTDMVVSTEKFPKPGETIFGNGFMTNHGGKGANQAVAVARLGGDTAFIAKVGEDGFGAATLEMLRGEGIDTTGVSVAPGTPSGVALITVAGGENNIVVCSGANALLSPDDIHAAEARFEEAGIVLMQLETPVETLTAAAELGKKYGAYVVLNPAPAPKEPLPEALLKNVDLLIPNETEAAGISGVDISGDETIPAAMDAIRQLGVKDVIITLGSRGACACIDGRLTIVPAFKVTPVDTTAAGDTFCSGLCVALSEGRGQEEAIRFAQKAASITVTRMGAQVSIPRREEVEI